MTTRTDTVTAEYRLPKAFASDHWNRDCGRTDVIVRETRSHFIVRMDDDGYGDMESDADYYVDCGSEMGRDYMGLVSSARATLRALRAAGSPSERQVAEQHVCWVDDTYCSESGGGAR